MSWEFDPPFDAAHRAALEAGKPLLYVCPPAGWALVPLLARLPAPRGDGPTVLVLAPDSPDVADVGAAVRSQDALQPSHAVTGGARTDRLLRTTPFHTLVATPADVLQLARRAVLKLDQIRHLVVAWPEVMATLGHDTTLETVLAETREAQRLIVTTDERHDALHDFLTRHAHRAPTLIAAAPPAAPTLTARYAVVEEGRRGHAVRELLDQVNPERAFVWDPVPGRADRWAALAADPTVRVGSDPGDDPVALAIATDLVSAAALSALAAAAADVIVLVRAGQQPYFERLVRTSRPFRLPSEADRARDRALELRSRVRARLGEGGLDGELLTLAPLFDEHDPALVAAAALALAGLEPEPRSETPAFVRLFVTVGKRDGARPADLVGALLNEVGLPKTSVGRIEIRDAFTLIEVRAEDADRAVRGLTGTTVRGRRVTARPERR